MPREKQFEPRRHEEHEEHEEGKKRDRDFFSSPPSFVLFVPSWLIFSLCGSSGFD
jgi:hypothetical protein